MEKSLKIQSIVCSILGIFTFFIWNLVVGILLIVRRDEFENPGLAIATGILQIVLPLIIPQLICSCLLKA